MFLMKKIIGFGKLKKYCKALGGERHGFSLMEVMASLAIVSLLMIGLYSLIELSIKVTADNAYIVEATEIASERMEKIRNMRYDDVGTITGSPAGIIPQDEIVTRNGTFKVRTSVTFKDDPYDGLIDNGTDSVFTDYKIVTIDVSWTGRFEPKKISVFSKVVPNTQETLAGYGLLKLKIVDSAGAGVPNADIHIENAAPVLNADYVSDLEGEFNLALLPDIEGYEVTVSKAGYSTEKTYARDAINLEPTKPNLSVYAGIKTDDSFSIDRLSGLTIRTVTNTLHDNWPVASSSHGSGHIRLDLDASDNTYFAWQDNGFSTSTVFLQKFNNANAKQWAANLKATTTSFQKNPDIAVTTAGTAYAVWQDNSTVLKQFAYNTGGYLKKFAKNEPTIYQPAPEITGRNKLSFFLKIKNYWQFLKKSFLSIGQREIKTKSADALSNVVVVQTKISNPVDGNNSISTSFDAPPAAGNILVAVAVNRNNNKSFSAPTNTAGAFTVSRYSNTNWALDVGIWHKVADAGEPSGVTITSNGDIKGGVLMLLEVSGLDADDLLNVTAANDQTGNNSTTASTGLTAASAADAFAVAAAAYADDDFNTPTSANWTSGSANAWTQRLWRKWSTGNNGSLAVATMNINAAAQQSATLTLSGGGNEERNSVLVVYKALTINQASVSASGNQNTDLTMPLADYYLGGKFIITENNTARDVNSIKLQEYGTVNAQAKISSMKLFYDLDTSAPYDCTSETYDHGTDAQFGASAVFDGADGFAQITQAGGVNISTAKTLCLYPVASVNGADNNDTLELKINTPSTDVTVSTGTVIPSAAVEINGSTVLKTPADIRQSHARTRLDDGDEISATWKQAQDTPDTMHLNENIRLRFATTNEGGVSSAPFAYRLEYGELTSDCDAISTWQALPTDDSLGWKITDSSHFADATPSTNATNGLTDEGLTFRPSQLKDSGNETAPLALGYNEFSEIEFNLRPTAAAGDQSFCFRLTDRGNTSDITYEQYAVVSVIGDDNIFIRAIDTNGGFLWPAKRVNADASDAEQTNPAIALAENGGQATTAVAWEDDRNGQNDIYLQFLDAAGNRLLGTDQAMASSTDPETAPTLAFDSTGSLFVAWVRHASSRDIYLSKFNQNGQLLAGPTALQASASEEYGPKIIFDADNNLYLAFTEETVDAKKAVIAKYDTGLTLVWEANPNAEAADASQYEANLGMNGSTLIAAWNDDRNGDKDIYAQKLSAAGMPLWSEDLKVNISLDAADQIMPALAIRSNGQAIGAWQDNRNGLGEIYAAVFADPAALVAAPNTPLAIIGTKKIGNNPVIYKYNATSTTDVNGYLTLPLEWDMPGYAVAIDAALSTKTIILRDPPQPLELRALENKTMLIYVE